MNRDPAHVPAPSRVVFVGNIPYEMSEEQLKDVLSRVGPVLQFRMVFDRESGKPRGYGFCEYSDVETAQSAIRNLNGFDVGGRTLRVDRADQESLGHRMASAAGEHHAPGQAAPPAGAANPLLAATGAPSVDAVHATLAAMSNTQLLEVLTQLKAMATQSPAQTRRLLADNPALAYAVFQALASMRLVDPATVQSVLAQNPAPARPVPPPPVVGMVPPPMHMPPPVGMAPPMHMAPPHVSPQMGHAGYPPVPPGYGPPPGDPQRALIARILAMSPDEIAALPPQQRDQVLQVRAQFAGAHAR